MSPDIIRPAVVSIFAVLVLVAAMRDLVSFTIPNWISLALAGAFLPAALIVGLPLPTIAWCGGVGIAMLVVGVGMFAMRWIGGGDAKLMAAASLWLGLQGLAPFVIYTALAGGALALLLLGMRSAWVRPFAAGGPPWVDRLATPGGSAPYGVAIALGALLAFFQQGVLLGAGHVGF